MNFDFPYSLLTLYVVPSCWEDNVQYIANLFTHPHETVGRRQKQTNSAALFTGSYVSKRCIAKLGYVDVTNRP